MKSFHLTRFKDNFDGFLFEKFNFKVDVDPDNVYIFLSISLYSNKVTFTPFLLKNQTDFYSLYRYITVCSLCHNMPVN